MWYSCNLKVPTFFQLWKIYLGLSNCHQQNFSRMLQKAWESLQICSISKSFVHLLEKLLIPPSYSKNHLNLKLSFKISILRKIIRNSSLMKWKRRCAEKKVVYIHRKGMKNYAFESCFILWFFTANYFWITNNFSFY